MPMMDYFKNPYHLPEVTADDYDDRKKFVVWYWEHWLPAIAGQGNPFMKKTIRRYHLPVESQTLAGAIIEGEKDKIQNVTKESEAFGYVMYQNCFTKWSHVVPKKVEDQYWKPPEYDVNKEDTHKYHNTEWSDGRNGQMKGQGWAPQAYVAMNKALAMFKQLRKEDRENNWSTMKAALDQVKDNCGIPLDQKEHSRKRKRGTTVSTPPSYTEIAGYSDDEYDGSD